MKKILHVYPQINCGGTEMVFYNLIKFGDREHFRYELLTQRRGDNEAAFADLGVPIHTVAKTSEKKYFLALIDFFKREHFDVVHAHMSADLPLVLKAAAKAGVPCRVAHSHNARVDIPRLLWPLFYFRHRPHSRYATQLFGCSALALQWLFPGKAKQRYVIHNGIDLDKFRFNPTARQCLRKELGIDDTTKVFINVGRCTEQKNQKFILSLAKERAYKNELYVIIGEGPLSKELTKQKNDGRLDNVILTGKRTDIEEWLSAADVFLFPSVYEGLGIVAVEAEASGLKVLASDTIPPEADMGLGNYLSVPLSNIAEWHRLMSQPCFENHQRTQLSDNARSSEYNIYTVTHLVEKIYSC